MGSRRPKKRSSSSTRSSNREERSDILHANIVRQSLLLVVVFLISTPFTCCVESGIVVTVMTTSRSSSSSRYPGNSFLVLTNSKIGEIGILLLTTLIALSISTLSFASAFNSSNTKLQHTTSAAGGGGTRTVAFARIRTFTTGEFSLKLNMASTGSTEQQAWTPGNTEQEKEAREKLDIWPLDDYNAALLNEVHPRGYEESKEKSDQFKPHEIYDLIAIGSGAGGLVSSRQVRKKK